MVMDSQIEGTWHFSPKTLASEHLRAYKGLVEVSGMMDNMEALMRMTGQDEELDGIMAQIKPVFKCFELFCSSTVTIEGSNAKALWYDPSILDKEGDDPQVFLDELLRTQTETFVLEESPAGSFGIMQEGQRVADIRIIDGDMQVLVAGTDSVVMCLGRRQYNLESLHQYAQDQEGSGDKITIMLMAEDEATQTQGLELLKLQDDEFHSQWLETVFDNGSFAVVEMTHGTLTDAFLEGVFGRDNGDFSGVEELNLASLFGARLTHLNFLHRMPNVTTMTLSMNEALVSLGRIGDMKKLRSLDLSNCSSIESFAPLAACTALESLEIAHSGSGDISFLKSLPKLRELKMTCFQAGDQLGVLASLSDLEHLELPQGNMDDLSFLKGLSNLKTLDMGLDEPDAGWADISPLAGLTQLEKVTAKDPEDEWGMTSLDLLPQEDPEAWQAWLAAKQI